MNIVIPEWLEKIEKAVARTKEIDGLFKALEGGASKMSLNAICDMERLCREVRDLMAIVSDLKEDRGEIYYVFAKSGDIQEIIEAPEIFLSRYEAIKFAKYQSNEPSRMSETIYVNRYKEHSWVTSLPWDRVHHSD